MPVLALKSTSVIFILLFGFFNFLGLNNTDISVKMKAFQNNTYYGILEMKNYQYPFEVYLMNKEQKHENSRVKIVFHKNGKDVMIDYDRNTELTDFDKKVITKIINNIEKPGNGIGDKIKRQFITGLNNIINKNK